MTANKAPNLVRDNPPRFTKGMLFGTLFAIPLWGVIITGFFTLAGCTTPGYETCDTPDCGDNVNIVVAE
jgi:hypothetical protein